MDQAFSSTQERFAGYVATLGRGPGKSRALTRAEAQDAFALVLADAVHPAQVGAFLMLLRYRGEDLDEITGLVEAARSAMRETCGTLSAGQVDLDWPSYGAGRTRGAPWFLLAALALSQSGVRVLMHGSNEFSSGIPVVTALAALGRPPATGASSVADALDRTGFAYWPIADLSPGIDRLLGMRRLFGLRSPVNTVARLLDPGDARASVDGVFHPAYIALHLGVAERLGRRSLLVIKGGGGEAERPAAKATAAHLWRQDGGRSELLLPALIDAPDARETDNIDQWVATWHGGEGRPGAVQIIVGSIALGLLALEPGQDPVAADRRAREIWAARRPT
ncbi:glycosyl transferase family protein [Lichenicola sp.]|uniref:glycosyl transferase family protein n=1 Tax=Lichenicola sp. TaxID=2804529 RepID=UPI003AFF9EAB